MGTNRDPFKISGYSLSLTDQWQIELMQNAYSLASDVRTRMILEEEAYKILDKYPKPQNIVSDTLDSKSKNETSITSQTDDKKNDEFKVEKVIDYLVKPLEHVIKDKDLDWIKEQLTSESKLSPILPEMSQESIQERLSQSIEIIYYLTVELHLKAILDSQDTLSALLLLAFNKWVESHKLRESKERLELKKSILYSAKAFLASMATYLYLDDMDAATKCENIITELNNFTWRINNEYLNYGSFETGIYKDKFQGLKDIHDDEYIDGLKQLIPFFNGQLQRPVYSISKNKDAFFSSKFPRPEQEKVWEKIKTFNFYTPDSDTLEEKEKNTLSRSPSF
jgi:hypothetical protein